MPQRFIHFSIRCWSALLLAAAAPAQQQPAANPGGTAFVHIRLNTDYDDSEDSLALLNTVARCAPARRITVAPGENLDKIFVREYGFGKSDLQKSYELLLQVILEKNNLASPQDLRPGSLVIPAVPKRTWKDWGRDNPLNYVANMMVYRADSAISAPASANRSPQRAIAGLTEAEPAEVAYRTMAPVGAISPKAPYTIVAVELAVKQAISLVESSRFKPGMVTAATLPLPVSLAQDDPCDSPLPDHPTLTTAQRDRIAQTLQQSSQRSPVVFILDTGWPSADAYKESLASLNNVLSDLWQDQFGLKFTRLQPQSSFAKSNVDHCLCIERGLRELRALDQNLDPSKRVRVVYLPLTREQNAEPVLTELLLTNSLLEIKSSDDAEITGQEVVNMRKETLKLVQQHFPAKWVGRQVLTDKSILDAVLTIGQIYAPLTQTLFFANESWTVANQDAGGKYHVNYYTPQFGMVTAAAGNDGSTNLLDFAQRCPYNKDTMAVLNLTATVVDPSSTRMPIADIDKCLAVGFDGYVTDKAYGTSFAAPRIAWFLAAGEAVRSTPLQLREWSKTFPDVLKSLRNPNATDYLKLYFDPVRYVDAQAGRPATTTR